MSFSISRSNSLLDALSAASSTPGVPGPSTATVPARGEPRLVGGSSAAGAEPESVPVKPLRGWCSPRPFCPGSFHRLRSPPRALSGPSWCVFSGLRGGVGPSRLLPTLRSAAPCPLLSCVPILASFWGPALLLPRRSRHSHLFREAPEPSAGGVHLSPPRATPRSRIPSHRPCLQGVYIPGAALESVLLLCRGCCIQFLRLQRCGRGMTGKERDQGRTRETE